MSGILSKVGVTDKRESYDEDFIYFWDDVQDSEFLDTKEQSFGEWFTTNVVLILHFLLLLIIIPISVVAFSINFLLGISLSFLATSIVLISYYIIRNRYIVPMNLLEDNFKEMQDRNLRGTDELLFSLDTSNIASEFNQVRSLVSTLVSDFTLRTQRMKSEANALQTMVNSIYNNVDHVSLSLENSSANTANHQELKLYLGQLSHGVDVFTENFDNSFSAVNEVVNTLSSIGKQTTMLALNAGIEAAKAGGRGRGFEVVAANLRRLAQHATDTAMRVKVSSEEISENAKKALEEITAGTIQIETMMEQSYETIAAVNNELYNSIGDLNMLKSAYQGIFNLLDTQEEELRSFRS
ncbi:MAG: methyl-accepting chemotaxis protein [Candidatus Kariarchaeaceae archaeon]|jgi:methyl-accepting chemotaxis protein